MQEHQDGVSAAEQARHQPYVMVPCKITPNRAVIIRRDHCNGVIKWLVFDAHAVMAL